MNPRTKAVWEFVVKYTKENNGRPPTVRELVGVDLKNDIKPITSTSVAISHVKKLVNLGMMTHRFGKAPAFVITGGIYYFPDNLFNFDIKKYQNVITDGWDGNHPHILSYYRLNPGTNFIQAVGDILRSVDPQTILVVPESERLYYTAVAFGLDILPIELVGVFLS